MSPFYARAGLDVEQPKKIKKIDSTNGLKMLENDEMFEFWFSQPDSDYLCKYSEAYPRKNMKLVRKEEACRNYFRKKYAKKARITDERIRIETERIKSLKNKYFQTRIKKLKDKIGQNVNEILIKQLIIDDFDPKKFDLGF